MVLLGVTTGLRRSELFAFQGVVGQCKSETYARRFPSPSMLQLISGCGKNFPVMQLLTIGFSQVAAQEENAR